MWVRATVELAVPLYPYVMILITDESEQARVIEMKWEPIRQLELSSVGGCCGILGPPWILSFELLDHYKVDPTCAFFNGPCAVHCAKQMLKIKFCVHLNF